MAEETTGSGSGSGTQDQQSQSGSGTQSRQSQADGDTTPQTLRSKDGKTWTLAEAVAHIEELNRENASHRTRAQRAEEERDSVRQERDRLAGEARAQTVREAALKEAEAQKARLPGVVADLVDPGAVEFDDKGKPTNLTKLIEAIRKRHADLFAAGNADGGQRGAPTGQDMNTLIRRAAGRG